MRLTTALLPTTVQPDGICPHAVTDIAYVRVRSHLECPRVCCDLSLLNQPERLRMARPLDEMNDDVLFSALERVDDSRLLAVRR